MIISRSAVALAACLLAAAGLGAQSPESPPPIAREFRGAWVASVSNIDWPSKPGLSTWQQKSELIAILDRLVELNMNAVILQVRPAADALYASKIEPWSTYLTGLEGRAPAPYYDPLEFAVAEAHARGLELHAWFNPYRAKHPSATGPHAKSHISVARPELVRTYGRLEWMDPGDPKVVDQTLRVMLDVVRRYDVDGIHIDDYFYPYPEIGRDSLPVPFPDSTTYAAYQKKGGKLARDDWRRDNVDRLIEQIYLRTKAIKPWVKVGISPFGIWRPGYPESIKGFDSYEKLYGDSRRWLREGWADYFTPQLYWPISQTPQSYPVLLDWWLGENAKKRHMWIGNYSSRVVAGGPGWTPDEMNAQVRATRATASTGNIFFSMKSLMPGWPVRRDSVPAGTAKPEISLADRLRTELYSAPALVPASPWLSKSKPASPKATLTKDAETGELVLVIAPAKGVTQWTVRALVGGHWRTWILPSGQAGPSARSGRQIIAGSNAGGPVRVVVTAVDRTGNESAPRELGYLR